MEKATCNLFTWTTNNFFSPQKDPPPTNLINKEIENVEEKWKKKCGEQVHVLFTVTQNFRLKIGEPVGYGQVEHHRA